MPYVHTLVTEEFELLEKPLREIDSTIEKFVGEHSDLIKKSDHREWISRLFEIRRRTYSDMFREIGIQLEYEPEVIDLNGQTFVTLRGRNTKKYETYEIFAEAYDCKDSGRPYINADDRSWLDIYRVSKTIRKSMAPPLDPQLVYQLLEEAYQTAKSFTIKDLKI